MAIEDAHIVARALSRYADDIPEALRAYEATRIPRAIQVQLASRAQSELFHHSTPRSTSFSVDWIYGYDPIRQPLEEKVSA
jgi:salicylate hydroxylase